MQAIAHKSVRLNRTESALSRAELSYLRCFVYAK